jgi:hypothetical protein
MLVHLLVFSWNGIDVIFLIKKLHLCHPKGHRCNFLITYMLLQENTRKTPEDVLAFLITNWHLYISSKVFRIMLCTPHFYAIFMVNSTRSVICVQSKKEYVHPNLWGMTEMTLRSLINAGFGEQKCSDFLTRKGGSGQFALQNLVKLPSNLMDKLVKLPRKI